MTIMSLDNSDYSHMRWMSAFRCENLDPSVGSPWSMRPRCTLSCQQMKLVCPEEYHDETELERSGRS